MEEFLLNQKCHINTNMEADTFVGIKCEDGDISVHFPLGFEFSRNEKMLKKEIMLLINTIAATVGHKESPIKELASSYDTVGFPIQACFHIIYDYYARGYYIERERQYQVAKRGKINWNRTIRNQKPVICDNKAIYLDFVINRNQNNENALITLIHEWCVYDAFRKIGWLFTYFMPNQPKIRFNQKEFLGVLKSKLAETFNDENKVLIQNMIALIENCGGDEKSNYMYGTYRFEYVWEKLIDRAFGELDKEKYFPKTTWRRPGKNDYDNACLEPDTIMLYKDKIYVLDAKYYKFGATGRTSDMPESTSINKQITYGEYIAETDLFKKNGRVPTVYNAFIMPYSADSQLWKSDANLLYVGEAVSNWKSNKKTYERVQGILLDVRYLMGMTIRKDENEIMKLARFIESAIEEN